jgi:hypothetical protein
MRTLARCRSLTGESADRYCSQPDCNREQPAKNDRTPQYSVPPASSPSSRARAVRSSSVRIVRAMRSSKPRGVLPCCVLAGEQVVSPGSGDEPRGRTLVLSSGRRLTAPPAWHAPTLRSRRGDRVVCLHKTEPVRCVEARRSEIQCRFLEDRLDLGGSQARILAEHQRGDARNVRCRH